MFIERQDMDDRIGLGDVIAATFATWEHPLRDGGLDRERSIYGTVDPEEIARVVDDFCVAALGARIDTYLFYAVSQGSVSGVRLTDGRRVVVKARTSTWTLPFLDAVYRVQSYLVAHGFPCPRPLLQPAPLGQGIIVAEAAMTFAFNWLLPGPQIAPSPDEARAFVREYEEARGAPFTAAEWESITAAATYALAYGARLEHSLSPAQTDYPSDGARARLAQYGDAFLVP